MCQWSKRKKAFDIYESHYVDEESFMTDIADICRERKVTFLLPSHNETEILARHREKLPKGTDALLPDAAHAALFNDKARSYDFASSIGIPVPHRINYSHPKDIETDLPEVKTKKYVIKLRTGNSAKGVFYATGLNAARSAVERLIAAHDLTPARHPQLEEYVHGEGWGCSVLYWQGQHIASFTHRRLREKISTGGTSTLREASINAALEESARRLFDAIGWHGLAMCEFKVCPETGRHWFIEVNPRLWGSLPLAISAGVEFPYLAWLCAVEGPEAALSYHSQANIRHGWRSRWLLGDLTVAAREMLSGRLDRAYRTIFRTHANGMDDFFWDDPLVFPGEVAAYLANVIRGGSINPSEKGMLR